MVLRSPYENLIGHTSWKSLAHKYDALTHSQRVDILNDVGIPMPNFEPFTIQDARTHAKLPFSSLSKEVQQRIRNQLG